jgi:large subunit ribosomal protein L10
MADKNAGVQQYKVDAVKALKDKFTESKDFIFTDYRGLTVEQITELRNQLREKNAEYRVVKNNFAKLAFKELQDADVAGMFIGPTALAMAKEDSGEIAKLLLKFGKNTSVDIKGALIEGEVFDPIQVAAYSKLPGRLDLISMLMSTMNAPVQNLVYAINGVTTKLVRTLQAVADKKAAD